MAKNNKIEINDEFAMALEMMDQGVDNVLLTGRAGTGKSTLLTYFRKNTKKRIVVLAPTGVAAINVDGVTIHSFFGFKPNITLSKIKARGPEDNRAKLCKKVDAFVIDEISMVRADLLDCVDKFLRLNGRDKKIPFGGAQMIFIGDLYQIPPVLTANDRKVFSAHYDTPFFFGSQVFRHPDFQMKYIELQKVYRQKDAHFIRLLNAVRNNSVDDESIDTLNQRLDPDFIPSKEDVFVTLVAVNSLADEINKDELDKLPGKIWRAEASLSGRFERSSMPAPEILHLKVGAQVMLLNNDSMGRWVNGTMGRVVEITKRSGLDDAVMVELDSGGMVDVTPNKWDLFAYKLKGGSIVSETIGSFVQYPIRVAFAITIHKSQGKTFDKVIIDLTRSTFAHGQLYVALSRCTSFEGLVLKKAIKKSHIQMDWQVVRFLTEYQYSEAEKLLSFEERKELLKDAIKNKTRLRVTYLKGKDERSVRVIIPKRMAKMKYLGHDFLGLDAFCEERHDMRIFNVEKLLRIEIV